MRSRKSSARPEQLALGWTTPGLVAGVDEVGRGPLAGPVVAAAVMLDDLQPIKGLRDSKTLGSATRRRLDAEIRAKALCVSVAEASVAEIDSLNILQATLLAMRRAVEGLRLVPARVLVDGNRLPLLKMPAEAIVKGDAVERHQFFRLDPENGPHLGPIVARHAIHQRVHGQFRRGKRPLHTGGRYLPRQRQRTQQRGEPLQPAIFHHAISHHRPRLCQLRSRWAAAPPPPAGRAALPCRLPAA